MDRINPNGPAVAGSREPAATGWDPHSVWQSRVRAARQPRTTGASASIELLDLSAGWDPLETWRVRVQRPRDAAK